EYEIAFNLFNISSIESEYISNIQTMLNIHQQVSCRSDKDIVWLEVKRSRDYYLLLIDNDIKSINLDISTSKSPAIATSGTQLKDDLRDVKTFFQSLRSD